MRYLVCNNCRDKMELTNDDRRRGFKERRVEIPHAHRPQVLNRRETVIKDGHVHITEEAVPKLQCDCCGNTIENGEPAVAVTQWSQEEPAPWEHAYAKAETN